MKTLFVRFVKDNSGATAIEYGLIAAGISVAIIAVVNGLGSTLNTKFKSISDAAEVIRPRQTRRQRLRLMAGAFLFCATAWRRLTRG